MTIVHQEYFKINENTYKILKVQTFPATTLTLSRQVYVGDPSETYCSPIFTITEGDIIWNSIVENQIVNKHGYFSLIPCFAFLKWYARHFEKKYPDALVFKNTMKAQKFMNRLHKSSISFSIRQLLFS